MVKTERKLLAFLLILLSLVAIAPMLEGNYPLNHSTHFNLSWAFQYQKQFFGGQFYPRWLEYSNFGFGNATFAFYPPICMVATLPFRFLGLGLAGSLIGSMALAIGFLGWGLYTYARYFYPLSIAATVAGVGMLSPYFMVDIYERGAIAEVWGITTLPWILWASQRLVKQPKNSQNILLLAFIYGLLILSHLPTLLIFTCVWLFLPWFFGSWQGVKGCYGGFILACSWTAFYLLPVIGDRRFIQIDTFNTFTEYLPQHRLLLEISRNWAIKFSDHWFDQQLIVPWLSMLAVVSLGLVVQFCPRNRNTENIVAFWLFISLFALLMTTSILAWVYQLLVPLQQIQFSWRWLSLATVTIPLLLGYLLHQAGAKLSDAITLTQPLSLPVSFSLLSTWGLSVATWSLVIITILQGVKVTQRADYQPEAIAHFASLAAAKKFPGEPHQGLGTRLMDWHYVFSDGLALVDVPEYRAKEATLAMPPQQFYPLLAWKDGTETNLTIKNWDYGLRQFEANNLTSAPRQVRLRTFYYPGWQIKIDGEKVPTKASSSGQLEVSIPPGKHQVKIFYRGTLMYLVGRVITLLTTLGCVIKSLNQ
ncbi:MAG: hypothetical protein WA896_08390 [Spirulinaceae cyanobacterium]